MLERRGAFKGPNGNRWNTITNLGASSVAFPPFRLQLTRCHLAGLIGSSLLIFLPPAIATFPQRGSIDPKKLEAKFKGLPHERVEFNKGL